MASVNMSIWNDYIYLKRGFPELEMSSVEVKPRKAKGSVILPELRNRPREVREALSFPIEIYYPDDFPDKEITVIDAERRIKWDIVPEEHRHDNGNGRLCTHLPEEIALISIQNRSYLIVYSAILLYSAYLKCRDTGLWPKEFKGWEHGDAGKRQFQRELMRIGRTR